MPTPSATKRMRSHLFTAGLRLEASTDRSGSAMVMMMPMSKVMARMTKRFRLLVVVLPTISPMGIIARSAPREKRVIPPITSRHPMRNAPTEERDCGARVKERITTTTVMGSTENALSFSLLSAI